MPDSRTFNGPYEGRELDYLSFPIGGLGAGMFCLEGTGAFSHFSLRHNPLLMNERTVFSAICIRGLEGKNMARVLEGPVPRWKPFYPWHRGWESSRSYGMPRLAKARFEARFPFATVSLADDKIPLQVTVVGWNPFVPGDADASSLPVGAVEYRFRNTSSAKVEAVYSFHADNFMAAGDSGASVREISGGFHLRQEPAPDHVAAEGSFAAWLAEPDARGGCAWFRGGWFDPLTMLWKTIEEGRAQARGAHTEGAPSPGGSLYLPFSLAPGEEKTVRLHLAWHVPYSKLRQTGNLPVPPDLDPKIGFHRPWYAERFKDIEELVSYWTREERSLHASTTAFTECFYDSTLPPEVIEAVAANLTILKSTTVLRQFDGKMWAWEGSNDDSGSCPGSCTHVWNYAQALPHLFPALERGLRELEFEFSQDEKGHQNFRAALPIGTIDHDFHSAADGQLGGLIKIYRDWRISGDTDWLRALWPKVRKSLDYCIETWDPDHRGALIEPHHNTYDIEFWGADGMCSSFYVGALQAAVVMGRALKENVAAYEELLAAGKAYLEEKLFDGEYFFQKTQWEGLRAAGPAETAKRSFFLNYSPEALELLRAEGPKYQYGEGCLSDGVLGEWMAWAAGLDPVLSPDKIEKHLLSVYRYNFRSDLGDVPNPQRPQFAFGDEPGLLLCTWPKGGKPSLPMVYSEEVWTGIEYQVASHLIAFGHVEEGLKIVQACRGRYDGTIRNPFDEIECGHWYARAMASYALLQALSGARYDAVEKTLYLAPRLQGDFRCFLATATGFGTVGVKDGKPFLDVKCGKIELKRIEYQAQSSC